MKTFEVWGKGNMLLDIARVHRHLQAFDLHTLFIEELGWEHHRQELIIAIDGQDFCLQALAHKRGLAAFRCTPDADGRIPSYPTRRKIETQVTKSVNQHLIIYADAANTQQVWQWVKRTPGKPTAAREQSFSRDQTGEALIQKLNAIAFSLEDEADIGGIVQVAERVRAGFDVERVTKRFYERFKTEHAGFLKFLAGIPDETAQRWYASVMINRLMFIYFIQKKGFLDGDPNYLRTRWAASAAAAPDQYYTGFLRPLFFQGFARREGDRSAETNRLLGQVPYLNGGIFEEHPIERAAGGAIQIADAAFERLFDFFDAYQWHLDERPLRADNEINPDVLGYIFEKYINQKQMGAYYTKEDITGYISQNTIIPYLFDAARQRMGQRIETDKRMSGATMWGVLADDPDRYIYPAVRHGAELPLPDEIAAGVDDVSKRDGWNRPAPAEYALPTEIWREVVARRQRYAEVKSNLQAPTSNLHSINDLITLNLDIRQFAQDVIAECEGPELLRAFWQAIESVTILDPTVGSGAFLFAALNVLEPLYEGCLERMQAFIDDEGRTTKDEKGSSSGVRRSSQKYSDFRKILARVAQHPNRRYFILKSIVVNNLYGVDIMEEAVEICKLRLFLKLVAQVERVEHIEPLPDIDFNVRAGNTLVGYVSREDVERALSFTGEQGKLLFPDELAGMQRFEERAADVERLFGLFRQQQTELGGQVTAADKAELRRRLDALDGELNRALARDYGVDAGKLEYDAWLVAHRPLHWFVEFYGIMRRGGFSVTIGNPPYIEYGKVKTDYSVHGYETVDCGNLYAFATERALSLLSSEGRFGMIIPVASVCTDGYQSLRNVLRRSGSLAISSFNDRPGKLFDGLEHIRLSIILCDKSSSRARATDTTKYNRWLTVERPTLFERLALTDVTSVSVSGPITKIGTRVERQILDKVLSQARTLDFYAAGTGQHHLYYTRKLSGFVQILDFIPRIYDSSGELREPSELKRVSFNHEKTRDAFLSVLNSNLFYWLLTLYSDCRNLNRREVHSMRFDAGSASPQTTEALSALSHQLMDDIQRNSKMLPMRYETLGTMTIQCIYPKVSKPVIDEIDCVLARHYGFTDEELDFIINYDIKYRMGDALEAADENE